MTSGIVYLIGAGPGDPGLISKKALNILSEADCVIYDYLANQSFIESLQCEKIFVGKKGSEHTLPQEEINKLIVAKAREGKCIVRLKGGDPFIFGRGGEEAEELLEAGISFSIVPGISSFYSAPAYAGIPLTHRNYANSFEVITGHRKDSTSEDEDINFPEYNDMKTFVFLMGMKNLKYISKKLISEKKFPADTPVGIISWGTTPDQVVLTGTLSNIYERAEADGIKSPAIIIIGKVVLLRDKLRWFDNMPLFGKKIVVTRTREQASVLAEKLTVLGANAIEFPTIEIRVKDNLSRLNEAISNIENYHWIIFTSQNAVNIFFNVLKAVKKDARVLHSNKIMAIGPATAKELNRYFIEPDIVPSEYVAEEIINEMNRIGIAGKRILLPCASEARLTLKEGLTALGGNVDRVEIYDTIIPQNISVDAMSAVNSADMITFTSSSTVKNFYRIVKNTNAKLACIGPITAETIEKIGYSPDITASEYTIDGLVDAILKYYK
jgi:uroporphyrinogen III methyltransferase / synthase